LDRLAWIPLYAGTVFFHEHQESEAEFRTLAAAGASAFEGASLSVDMESAHAAASSQYDRRRGFGGSLACSVLGLLFPPRWIRVVFDSLSVIIRKKFLISFMLDDSLYPLAAYVDLSELVFFHVSCPMFVDRFSLCAFPPERISAMLDRFAAAFAANDVFVSHIHCLRCVSMP